MSRIAFEKTILGMCLAVLLSGCSTVDLPHSTSKGYGSGKFFKSVGPPLEGAERSTEVNQAIQDAIGAAFEKQGIAMGAENAELVVGYLLLIQDNVSTLKIDSYFGHKDAGEKMQEKAHRKGVLKREERLTLDRGAIVIDVTDAKRDKLIYRNFAVRDILEDIPADKRRARIEEAVQEALADFLR